MDHPAKILWPILEKQDVQKLEAEQAERIKRAEARAKQRKLLQAAVQARQEADQATRSFFLIGTPWTAGLVLFGNSI